MMPNTFTIDIAPDILGYIVSATEEVFEMMVFQKVEPLPAISASDKRPPSNVVASVAFAGHRRGYVAFHSTLDTARGIAGAMLGMAAEEIGDEMPDAIGEVTNMIAGTFRNKLAAVEPTSAIAVPTVTIGSDFSTFCTGHARRAFCPFVLEGQRIFVELVLSPD
jgi:chemotaxis protein CheX